VIDLSELSHDELMERANARSAKAGGMMGWVEKHTLDSRFTQLSEGSPPTTVGIGFGGADARFPSGNLHRFRRDGWVLRSGSGGDAGAETFYSGVAPEKRKKVNKQMSRLSHGGGPARKLSNSACLAPVVTAPSRETRERVAAGLNEAKFEAVCMHTTVAGSGSSHVLPSTRVER
jgi:hypothetical protein